MNTYLTSVIENVKKKHGNEPEFVQTVEEVFSSLEPVIEKHPEYEKVDLLNRMVEPERMFTFRVKVSVERKMAYVQAKNSRTRAPEVDMEVSTAMTKSSIRFSSLVSGGSTRGMLP